MTLDTCDHPPFIHEHRNGAGRPPTPETCGWVSIASNVYTKSDAAERLKTMESAGAALSVSSGMHLNADHVGMRAVVQLTSAKLTTSTG